MKKTSKKLLKAKALEDLTVFLLSELLDSKYALFQERMEDYLSQRLTSLKSVDLRKVLLDKDRVLLVDAHVQQLAKRISNIEDKLAK